MSADQIPSNKKNQNTNENDSPKPQVESHNYLENRIVLVTLKPISCKKGFTYRALLHRAFQSALLAPLVFFFQKNIENIELAAFFRLPDHQQELLVLMYLSSCDTTYSYCAATTIMCSYLLGDYLKYTHLELPLQNQFQLYNRDINACLSLHIPFSLYKCLREQKESSVLHFLQFSFLFKAQGASSKMNNA